MTTLAAFFCDSILPFMKANQKLQKKERRKFSSVKGIVTKLVFILTQFLFAIYVFSVRGFHFPAE